MWEVLHAGKFVDGRGVVLERAEHEFLARSEGFPEALRNAIARQDPTPRLRPVPWPREGAAVAFAQTTVRVEGRDHALRVIDHRAFEGPADRPGRPYRRRIYLYNPSWGPGDATLPLALLQEAPRFQRHTIVPTVEAKPEKVQAAALAADLAALLDTGSVSLGAVADDTTRRLGGLLAALPSAIAARVEVQVGDGAQATVTAGARDKAATADATGQAWLRVLKRRGAQLDTRSLQTAADAADGLAWAERHDAPWQRLHKELAWLGHAADWRDSVVDALAKDHELPEPSLPPSPRLLAVVLPILQQAQAFARLGPLGAEAWSDAWRGVEAEGPWVAVQRLLSGAGVDAAALARLPLEGPAAARAVAAMARLDEPAPEVLASRQAWCKAARDAHGPRLVATALAAVIAEPGTWRDHPLRRLRHGIALDAVLEGTATAAHARTLAELGQAGADAVAALGDAAANARAYDMTGHLGQAPRPRVPEAAAALDVLAGRPVSVPVDPKRFAAAWKAFGVLFDPVRALRLGLPAPAAEACLSMAGKSDPAALLAQLLRHGDTVDAEAWRRHMGRAWTEGPLCVLDGAGHPGAAVILSAVPTDDVPRAACLVGADWPASWCGATDGWFRWLRQGGGLAPVRRLASKDSAAAAAVLTAFLATRNADAGPSPRHREAAVMLDETLAAQGWMARRTIQREARRLLEAA